MIDYDWQDDSKKSYDLALEIKRNRGDRYWPKRESEKHGTGRTGASESDHPSTE